MKRGNKTKFGRTKDQRTALEKSLVTALIDHGSITTTQAKAKFLSTSADKLITLAKKQSLAARRMALQSVGQKAMQKLFAEVAPKFQDRKGGYTRIVNLGQRKSDGSPMALVEFVQ